MRALTSEIFRKLDHLCDLHHHHHRYHQYYQRSIIHVTDHHCYSFQCEFEIEIKKIPAIRESSYFAHLPLTKILHFVCTFSGKITFATQCHNSIMSRPRIAIKKIPLFFFFFVTFFAASKIYNSKTFCIQNDILCNFHRSASGCVSVRSSCSGSLWCLRHRLKEWNFQFVSVSLVGYALYFSFFGFQFHYSSISCCWYKRL